MLPWSSPKETPGSALRGHENDVEKAGPRRPQTLPQAPQHEPIQLER